MVLVGDALEKLKILPDESVHCCVTSPPYWGLRDYGRPGQIGLEISRYEFIESLVTVFQEVKRVLRRDGTLWLNLGDSYCGGGNNRGAQKTLSPKQKSSRGARGQVAGFGLHKFKDDLIKPKDLVGIPWRVAFALQADGWHLRQDIIWHKPNPMPESVKDRCTKAHEYMFLFAKNNKYFYDRDAIREPYTETRPGKFKPRASQPSTRAKLGSPAMGNSGGYPQTHSGKNKRSVWTVKTKPLRNCAHFATFPPDLIRPCILAGCPKGGTVLDPFFGAGTTGLVALETGREYIGIELNPEYAEIANKRLEKVQPLLT